MPFEEKLLNWWAVALANLHPPIHLGSTRRCAIRLPSSGSRLRPSSVQFTSNRLEQAYWSIYLLCFPSKAPLRSSLSAAFFSSLRTLLSAEELSSTHLLAHLPVHPPTPPPGSAPFSASTPLDSYICWHLLAPWEAPLEYANDSHPHSASLPLPPLPARTRASSCLPPTSSKRPDGATTPSSTPGLRGRASPRWVGGWVGGHRWCARLSDWVGVGGGGQVVGVVFGVCVYTTLGRLDGRDAFSAGSATARHAVLRCAVLCCIMQDRLTTRIPALRLLPLTRCGRQAVAASPARWSPTPTSKARSYTLTARCVTRSAV